jgi:hypothetical protein
VATAYAYDVVTNAWSALPNMSTPRYAFAAATGPDGLIYAVGGSTGSGSMSSVEAYSLSANTWSSVAPMANPRVQHVTVTGPDGRIYAYGGNNMGCGIYASMEVYDVTMNAWSAATSMPEALDKLSGAVGPDGRLYAISGATSGCSQADTSAVFAYDVSTTAWTSVATLPTPRESAAAATAFGPNGFIYLVAGGGSNGPPNAGVAAYDVATNTW